MSNPFDDEERQFVVVVNHERQYALWPANMPVPAGWDVTFGSDKRAACLEYIERTWTDMRPASLVDS